jgi:hypothetical protein
LGWSNRSGKVVVVVFVEIVVEMDFNNDDITSFLEIKLTQELSHNL